MKLNKLETAIATIEEGEKQNPDQVGFFILMSDLYSAQQSYEKANVAIQKALEIDPENQEALQKRNTINSLLRPVNENPSPTEGS